MKACVIVPTYNERGSVEPLLERLRRVGVPGLQVLFVDDSSPDGTADAVRAEMSKDASVHLIVRSGKKGIGSAHVAGFSLALSELGADAVVEMDADLQHPPEKIPELLASIGSGADVAVASRKVEGGGAPDWSFWRRTVSGGANLYARVILGIPVKDCTSGFRALGRNAAQALVDAESPSSEYFFQVASLYLLRKRGMKMVEVPFVFGRRTTGESKLGWGEVFRFFVGVLKLRASSDG